MFYYNVLIGSDTKQTVIALTQQQYITAVAEVINDFDYVGIPNTKNQITYHKEGFYLATEDELKIESNRLIYYKISLHCNELKVHLIHRRDYNSIKKLINESDIYHDVVMLNNKRHDVIGYHCFESNQADAEIEEEGFYIALAAGELIQSFNWSRTCAEVD